MQELMKSLTNVASSLPERSKVVGFNRNHRLVGCAAAVGQLAVELLLQRGGHQVHHHVGSKDRQEDDDDQVQSDDLAADAMGERREQSPPARWRRERWRSGSAGELREVWSTVERTTNLVPLTACTLPRESRPRLQTESFVERCRVRA